MAPTNLAHRRTHSLLLISKLLNQRDHASPFTLVQDTLEQPAKPLIREYIRRARLSKTQTTFLAFEAFRQPHDVDQFITCHDKNPQQIAQACSAAVASSPSKRSLILIDSLTTLIARSTRPSSSLSLSAYLSSLLQAPRQSPDIRISLVAVCHTDIPIDAPVSPYSPSPLSLLSYLATTIVSIHSLAVLLAEKAARDRSLAAPASGLAEEAEGVLIGLKPLAKSLQPEDRGIVLELEHRRKSGRGVHEWYFLSDTIKPSTAESFREIAILLDDHPRFRKASEEIYSEELADMTFSLDLTSRQRLERDGVVLPYFDAQKGINEGGRIVYEMGIEDDFDEEEDEI